MAVLKVEGLRAGYGGSEVLHGVSIEVRGDEVVSIIGPNGAGKTTLLLTIAGLVRPVSGRITYMREEVTSLPVHERVRRGLVLCPERRRLFPEMTVGENVMAGAYLRNDKDGIRKDLEKVFEIFPFVRERWRQMAGTLSGGEQQMVAIARALMSRPRLLMLDEPSVGLAPVMKVTVFEKVKEIREREGIPVLVVEQDAYLAMSVSDRTYVIESGSVVMEGRSAELMVNDDVKSRYLGV
jgi:branched-chain amino acid transport system ATP-binding protein